VVLSNLVSITAYVIGFIILFSFYWIVAVIYFIFVSVLEYRLLSNHCTSCYYWDKTCGFGKGKISSWLFRRKYSSEFCNKNITWSDMLPDMLVSFAPIIAGIGLIIIKFDLILLSAVVIDINYSR
jgi:hypothetical protein